MHRQKTNKPREHQLRSQRERRHEHIGEPTRVLWLKLVDAGLWLRRWLVSSTNQSVQIAPAQHLLRTLMPGQAGDPEANGHNFCSQGAHSVVEKVSSAVIRDLWTGNSMWTESPWKQASLSASVYYGSQVLATVPCT